MHANASVCLCICNKFDSIAFNDETILTFAATSQENVDSESDVSYTDSGIPTTETITPSPMNFDARFSDQEDDEERKSSSKNEVK